MISDSEKEQLRRDYWLGRFSPEETAAFEAEAFGSDVETDLLEAAREDIIQEYLGGDLPAGDKLLFEKNFLSLAPNLRDTVTASIHREMIDEPAVAEFLEQKATIQLESVSLLRSVRAFLVSRMWQTGLVSALLMVGVFLVFFLMNRNSQLENDLAVAIPSESPALISNANILLENTSVNNINTIRTNTNDPSNSISSPQNVNASRVPRNAEKAPSLPSPAGRAIIALALGGGFRSNENKIGILRLDKETKLVKLSFPMPGLTEIYESFSVSIVQSSSGKGIYDRPLPDLAAKRKGDSISVEVPANKLAAGRYKLNLAAKRSEQNDEVLSFYEFTVQR